MIKAHKILINSIPDGGRKKIAEKLGVSRQSVNQVLDGETNPMTRNGLKIVDMAGAMAAREILEFSWDLKNREV